MQAQPMSAYKRLAWLLLLIVIGVYALHLWYSGRLKDDLTAQKGMVAAHTQSLKQHEEKLALATQTEQGLRAEVQTLTGRIDTATQAKQALEADLAALKQQHADSMAAEQAKAADALAAAKTGAAATLTAAQAEAADALNKAKTEAAATLAAAQKEAASTLAAAQEKAAQAYAELQGRFDTATKAAAAMGAEILQLKQAQVDAAASHQAQMATLSQEQQAKLKEVEDQLNGRIAALQTTLEGTDPERAALFASFDQRLQANQTSIADLEAAKADLTNQLNTANQTIEADVQALAKAKEQMQASQAELTQTRGELSQLQSQHDAAMEKATLDQAALQAKHDAAVEKAAAERAAMADQHAAAMDQAAKQQADLKAQHAAAIEAAAQKHADLEAQHAAAMDAAAKQQADLKTQHAAAMDAAAKQQADLKAAHAAALDKAAQETAALKAGLEGELAQAKATHADAIGQAQGRIETLTANLAAETAALAALQTKHDNMSSDLNAKLSETEQTLTGIRSELSAAQQAAAEQKTSLEQQIAAAKDHVATLEGTLADERKQAEAALAASKQAHVDAMERQHNLLVQVSALGGKETERGLLLTLAEADLRFPVSKATLPSGDLPSLDRMAALMTQFPRLTARIEGHTDASGREETNLDLSQERADAVMQALVERGIPVERMEAVGIGEARPIADNKTRAGSSQNRRVEVYVIEATR